MIPNPSVVASLHGRQLSLRRGKDRIGITGGGAVRVQGVGQTGRGRLEGRRIGRRQRCTTGQRDFRFVGGADRKADEGLQVCLHRGDVDLDGEARTPGPMTRAVQSWLAEEDSA